MAIKQFRKNGFTLIELLVAVAVVGILSAIAIPSYQESMRKSRRSDAQGELMNFSNGMERYYTQFSTYCGMGTSSLGAIAAAETCTGGRDNGGAATDTGIPPGNVFAARGETAANYTFWISAVTANSFTLRATPVAGGAQSTDGMIELDSTGVRRWDENNDDDFTDAGEVNWDKGK